MSLDFAGVSRGQFIGLQTTTKGMIAGHLRGFTNPKNTFGPGSVPVETHVREFLAQGGLFYIAGLWQEGGKGSKWNVEIVQVTPELLDSYISRKRK